MRWRLRSASGVDGGFLSGPAAANCAAHDRDEGQGMSIQKSHRDIQLPCGGVARLSGDRLFVYEAIEVCLRRRSDATMHEVFEIMSAQLGYQVQANKYSGRFSELCDIGVLERAPEKRDDATTIRSRAQHGRAARVFAYRLPVVQSRMFA